VVLFLEKREWGSECKAGCFVCASPTQEEGGVLDVRERLVDEWLVKRLFVPDVVGFTRVLESSCRCVLLLRELCVCVCVREEAKSWRKRKRNKREGEEEEK
jgi:hypothetical protein